MDELPKGRALDALVETRLTGAAAVNPPHYSSSHAASLALQLALEERGWRRDYGEREAVRLLHVDGRRVEAAGPDRLVALCRAALQALEPPGGTGPGAQD